MKLILQLSGEHPSLPKAEVSAVYEGEGITYEAFYEVDRLLCIDAKTSRTDYLQRLSMVLSAAEYVAYSSDLDEIASALSKKIKKGSKIAVRSRSSTLEKELGKKLADIGYGIRLDKPDAKIVCYKTDKGYLVGIDIPLERDYSARRPQFRPYFHPTSMHPKLARTLVNLSRVKKGSKVLDPFCGTGGILIEAALSGMDISGSDIDPRMVSGCRKNLEAYKIKGELVATDALDLQNFFSGMDAVVTDPPYARSSFATEKNLANFYWKFLSSAAKALKKNGFLVFMIPNKYEIEFSGFHLIEEFHLKVHKSLTRRIIVLQKEG